MRVCTYPVLQLPIKRCLQSVRQFSLKAKLKGKSAGDQVTSSTWETATSGKTLVIVESPAKARTIQKFLDESKYTVDSCAGHVRELMKRQESPAELKKLMVQEDLKLDVGSLGVNVYNNFEPIYVNMERKSEIIRRLKKLTSSCSRILLASDEDREGEAISW